MIKQRSLHQSNLKGNKVNISIRLTEMTERDKATRLAAQTVTISHFRICHKIHKPWAKAPCFRDPIVQYELYKK
jgi:hypothetical protein